jgi:hypothetical protein
MKGQRGKVFLVVDGVAHNAVPWNLKTDGEGLS